MVKCIVTGAKGFVASHLIEHLLKNTDWDIIGFDKMGYASLTADRIKDIDTYDMYEHRLRFYDIDLNLPVPWAVVDEIGQVDYILHLAADSHVDKSIEDPIPFVVNNVVATMNMLEYAKTQRDLKMFINFSTDEVFGPAAAGQSFKEDSPHNPTNPYAASKSAQEQLGKVWSNCWGVPVVTTHTMNIIGERQHPEKFVPLIIKRWLDGESLLIHANRDKTKAGSRAYLHARNLADALLHIINLGYQGYEEWNIAGLEEIDNLELALRVQDMAMEVTGKTDKFLAYELVDFHSSRPGHDLRYALDSSKLLESGYTYPKEFDESLRNVVEWTLANKDRWLDR